MTTPPSGDEPDQHDDADDARPGHTPDSHPGWGSAPQQPGTDPFGGGLPPYPGPDARPDLGPPPPTPPGGYGPPPPGYGLPPGYYPPPAYGFGPPSPTTNQKAIWSLVLGIVSFCCCLTGIVAIILGVIARQEVEASRGWQTGGGMALAGIITGSIGLALSLLLGVVNLGLS